MVDRAQYHHSQFVPVVFRKVHLRDGYEGLTMRYIFDVSLSPNSATSISVSVSFAAVLRGTTSGNSIGGR